MENAQQVGFWVGVLFGGFIVGAVCGILPLVLALKRERRKLAIISWVSCVVAGLVLGVILALPVAIVFTIVIVCLKKPEVPGEVQVGGNEDETILRT